MEKIILNNVENLDQFEEKEHKNHSDFILSNPLKTELLDFNIKNGDIEFEIEIMYKSEKWKLIKKLSEIISLIKKLKSENFTFIKESYFLKYLDLYFYDLNLSDNNLLSEINENCKKFLKYINYRFDILISSNTKEFFKINNFSFKEEFTKILKAENLEQIYNFQIENSDMTLSDFAYNSELGLLVLGLEDCSVLSTIGRFWSLIDYEVLGSVLFYQRVYDKNDRPYFRKITIKSFDARVSKILISIDQNKIYIGLDNGTIQIFLINFISKNMNANKNSSEEILNSKCEFINSHEHENTFNIKSIKDKTNNYNSDEEKHILNENNKLIDIQKNKFLTNTNLSSNIKQTRNLEEENTIIIVINEGLIFKPLIERITGLDIFENFLFISSKDNKLVILDVAYNKPELRFNGSLKKRMEGKGHIKEIFIDKKSKNLFVMTVTDKVLIYKLTIINKNNISIDTCLNNKMVNHTDIKIEYFNEINTIDNIKNYFLGNYNLFIATENKIQVCDLKKIKEFSNSNNTSNWDDSNIIPFDGSLDDGISISSKFVSFEYSQGSYITSVSYFCDMKLIILGLYNGNLIAVSSKSLEVLFAKKISENPIVKMILLEEKYVVIISDEKGNIFFYQFGI